MSDNSFDHIQADHQRQLYGVNDDDVKNIRAFGKKVKPEMDRFIELFYEWLGDQPEFQEFFVDEETVRHVKELSAKYWHEFFDCDLDDNYMRSRQNLGDIHARIGLPLAVYMAAMNFALGIFTEKIDSKVIQSESFSSIVRLFHLDTAIVVATYALKSNEAIAAQSKLLMEMSTPVTQIWDGVDSKRAQEIMNSSLEKIAESRAGQFIMDISGVAVVDTAVANYLIKITRATGLMGCTSTISGVSPAIAQTIVELGIDVEGVQTTATMQDALAQAVNLIGGK
jgi:rsbT co-antagonist protein RsbR